MAKRANDLNPLFQQKGACSTQWLHCKVFSRKLVLRFLVPYCASLTEQATLESSVLIGLNSSITNTRHQTASVDTFVFPWGDVFVAHKEEYSLGSLRELTDQSTE